MRPDATLGGGKGPPRFVISLGGLSAITHNELVLDSQIEKPGKSPSP